MSTNWTSSKHQFPGHKECPERIEAIAAALEAGGLTAAARPGQVEELQGFPAASLEHVLAIHDEKYVAAIERLSGTRGTTVVESAPTFVTPTTYEDSLLAAGAVLSILDALLAAAPASQAAGGQLAPTGFAICRPPGHHAVPAGAMGFCIFSNAAIAAQYAQQRYGLKKVAILDPDVHHGNGTNDIFYEDPSVLFISTHQAGLFPGTGRITETGSGPGAGATINIPLPGDSGHEAMLAVFDEVIAPALRRFEPNLIIVSAGYDAHWRDPLGGLQLRTATYHALAERIRGLAEELCQGRLLLVLEGGYDLKALGESVANTFLGLLGEPALDRFNADLLREEPMEKVWGVIDEVKRLHHLS
ncbi:hypothetical protein N2152v2_011276 [Parachlorella kessleri]